jgi:hypothetical protein
MGDYAESQLEDPVEHSAVGDSATLESVLCTEELHRRPARLHNYEKENRALVTLAEALSDSPGTVLQTLTNTLLDLVRQARRASAC